MAKIQKKVYEDPLLSKDSKGVFNLYHNRNSVGDKLIKSFMGLELNQNENGFLMDEKNNDIGIISQCYGLITLMEFAKFKIDLSKYDGVIEKINATLEDIFEMLGINTEEKLLFAASPYVMEEGIVTRYVETAALALRVFIEVRDLLWKDYDQETNTIEISEKYVAKTEDMTEGEHTLKEIEFIESLITRCMIFIGGVALRVNGDEGEEYYLNGSEEPLRDFDGANMKYKGWTFALVPEEKHAKTEMSLYYTYVVCEAYLAFYESFKTSISKLRALRQAVYDKMLEDGTIGDLSQMVIDAKPEAYGIEVDKNDKELYRDFKYLQKNYSIYKTYNKAVLDAGHYVDMQFSQIDTTKDFFNYNFKLVTAEDVENSSANDALFNVLYAVNIMMASGVDLDYADNDKKEEFYDRLQYTVPNVQRFYRKLNREGKGDMYDQYTLKINTAIPNDDMESANSLYNQARALRKQHAVVAHLTPLIIKTYATVSKYTIPYPQYEMRSYKDEILKKKMNEEWLWDNENYNLINNFDYVYALRTFYDYYEVYERPYSLDKTSYIKESNEKIETLEKQVVELKDALNDKIEANKQTKKELKAKHEEEMEELRQELLNQKAPVEAEIEKIAQNAAQKLIEEKFAQILTDIISQNGRVVPESGDFNALLKKAMLSYIPDAYNVAVELFDASEITEGEGEKEAEPLIEEAIKDIICDKIRSFKS